MPIRTRINEVNSTAGTPAMRYLIIVMMMMMMLMLMLMLTMMLMLIVLMKISLRESERRANLPINRIRAVKCTAVLEHVESER